MRESPDSFSDGMFVPDKEWNAAYIHVIYSCSVPDKVEEELDCIHVLWDEHCVRCYGLNSKQYSCTVTQVFMPYWN